MITQEKIDRINALARKAKTPGGPDGGGDSRARRPPSGVCGRCAG